MAFAPIALTTPQYEDFPNQFLKAFEQGTVTPLAMATDETGTTTASKFELDSQGFPITAGNARIIPFIDGDYDLWLFPTAAEADANDTSNAIQFADDLNADPVSSILSISFDSMFSLLSTGKQDNFSVVLKNFYTTGAGGGGTLFWDGDQNKANANGGTIIDPDTLGGWLGLPSDIATTYYGASGQGSGIGTGCWMRVNSDVFNVLDFGAIRKRDSVIDTTVMFQAAHDAIPTTGGTIYAPDGKYLLNKTVQDDQFAISTSNVTFTGDGWGTILEHTATGTVTGNNAVVMIRPTGGDVTNIILKDFTIKGPTTNTGAVIFGDNRVLGTIIHDGVSSGEVKEVIHENIMIDGMETACFALTGFSTFRDRRIAYRNCWAIRSRQDGFNDFGGGAFDVSIIGCYAIDLDGFGIEMATSGGLLIDGNIIRNVGQSGIGLEYVASLISDNDVVISNNKISDIFTTGFPTSSGISLGQSVNPENTRITGNTIMRTGGNGIVGNLLSENIVIQANQIHDVGKNTPSSGISGFNGTYIRVLHNTIRTQEAGYVMTTGISIVGSSDTNLIEDNQVDGETTTKIGGGANNRITRGIQPVLASPAVGNVGTGEDDLITHSIPARTVERDKQSVRVTAWGTTAVNPNNKRVKMYFGGKEIADTGALAANNKDWKMTAIVIRASSTIIESSADGVFNNAVMPVKYIVNIGQDFTAATIVKCTGEATANDDIIQKGMIIEHLDT